MKRKPITDKMKLEVLRRWNCLAYCAECFKHFTLSGIQFDHHLALVDGGEHAVENLRPLCPDCRQRKSACEHRENCRAKRRRKKHSGQDGNPKRNRLPPSKPLRGRAAWPESIKKTAERLKAHKFHTSKYLRLPSRKIQSRPFPKRAEVQT